MLDMLDIYKIIRLDAELMELGQTCRQVCPCCNGGPSKERSLSVTLFHDLKVKFQCFRESCPRKLRGSFYLTSAGYRDSLASMQPLQELKPVKVKRKKFDGPTYPLTDKERAFIFTAWGITRPRYWYHTEQYGGRIAMSVRSPLYKARGWVLRDLEGKARVKALTYVWEEEVPLSWYKDGSPSMKGTLIVEDIPSAVRASTYIDAVALLGTGCGLDRAREIGKHGQRPIIVALDQDATTAAFDMVARWGLSWGQAKVLPLKEDLKDLQERDLMDLLGVRP